MTTEIIHSFEGFGPIVIFHARGYGNAIRCHCAKKRAPNSNPFMLLRQGELVSYFFLEMQNISFLAYFFPLKSEISCVT